MINGLYRSKPVVVEAVRVEQVLLAARSGRWQEIPAWLRDAYEAGGVVMSRDHIAIQTLEGVMRAEGGDWIIRGVAGELYPCKPDIFAATYEPVEGEQ